MAVETGLAKHHWDRVKSREPNTDLQQAQTASSWTSWPRDTTGRPGWRRYGVKPIDEVVVRQPDFFTAMAGLLD